MTEREIEAAELLSCLSQTIQTKHQSEKTFIGRIQEISVVNSAIKSIGDVIESGKNKSSVLKFSADAIHSSAKSIIDNTCRAAAAIPVIEGNAKKMDQFACRQLDKWEKANFHQYLSDESIKILKFCFQLLKSATAHIDNQISILKNATTTLIKKDFLFSQNLYKIVSSVKNEVIITLRKIVDTIGRVAGRALPGEAKSLVRNFILSLPGIWASVNKCIPANTLEEESLRVITLAEESNDMLKKAMLVFQQTVEAAEYMIGVVKWKKD